MKNTKRTTAKNPAASRAKLLAAFLKHVPFDGWSETAYTAALKSTGMAQKHADKLFPDALTDLSEFFAEAIDEAMQQKIAQEKGFARMRVRDKVAFAVRARLEYLAPHREALRRLMLWHAMPQRAVHGLKRFADSVDLIWQAAGDTSTDYNFYTKRILLAGVMKATLIFWMNDTSQGSQATWDFLDRRIGDVLKLGKSLSLLKEFKPSELVDMARKKVRSAF